MLCVDCHSPIFPERIEAVPDATCCVSCLRLKGDVAQKRGFLRFDHKTGGTLEVVSPEQFQRMRELPNNIEERVSRL